MFFTDLRFIPILLLAIPLQLLAADYSRMMSAGVPVYECPAAKNRVAASAALFLLADKAE